MVIIGFTLDKNDDCVCYSPINSDLNSELMVVTVDFIGETAALGAFICKSSIQSNFTKINSSLTMNYPNHVMNAPENVLKKSLMTFLMNIEAFCGAARQDLSTSSSIDYPQKRWTFLSLFC